MSTLPIFDYGAPAEGPGAGDAGAPGQPAAVPEIAVPTEGAAFAREAAIVPPEGADDLVSRAQWQWAIGESEAARGAKGASPAGDGGAASPGTTKKRPTPRSRASPPVPGKTVPKKSEPMQIPSTKNASTENDIMTSRRAAETAIARVEVEEARVKLAVVERLLEEKPIACSDAEYAKDGNTKNDPDALETLRRLVKPLTGDEFMRACEERRLAGKCGWPLCGKTLDLNPGDDDKGRRRVVTTPDGSAGSVRGGRGTYRIDAVRRKVYLRGDLAMFCGDAHREEAEAIGVSLAISLEASGASEAEKKASEKEPAKNHQKSDGAEGSGGSFAKDAKDAKAKAMGDANVHVKASVLEKRPPAVVERRAPDAAPRPPSLEGLLGGEKHKAAAAVEGYVPRRDREIRSTSKRRTDERRAARTDPEPTESKSADASKRVVSKPESDVKHEPLSVPGSRIAASPLGARALDLQLERNAGPDDSTLAPGAANGNPSEPSTGATFFFDVFAEGLEKAERGANMMGTFSEGQLSRVVPEAALPALGLEADDGDGDGDGDGARGENGGDAANDAAVAAAMAAATRAADAAAAAAGGDDARRAAAAEEALVKAREVLKATLTRVGANERGDGRDGDDEDDGSRASGDSDDDSDDDDALVAGSAGAAISEFGTTWMMLDGWVTRATFAYVSADDVVVESETSGANRSEADGDASDREPISLPPRLGYAKQMSDAAASELQRALPSVRAALGIRASALQLERSLGELLRTFFFDQAIPGLRPERWALLVAAMLERGVAARANAAARKRENAANATDASGTKQHAAVVPPIAEDIAAARLDGGALWAFVAAAGATKEEYEAYGDLIAGECAKSW